MDANKMFITNIMATSGHKMPRENYCIFHNNKIYFNSQLLFKEKRKKNHFVIIS